MTKYLIHIFFLVLIAFIVITVLKNQKNETLPSFASVDEIVSSHKTNIQIKVQSFMKPTAQQIKILENDYAAVWAHLNHLYNTNQVEAGKEYYTEDFFKSICNKTNPIKNLFSRKDLKHNLHITEWARDGLVCIATDSNVILQYNTTENKPTYTKAHIAVALLLQGEHWRIDAIQFLNEENTTLK